jgi:hypothetical protein
MSLFSLSGGEKAPYLVGGLSDISQASKRLALTGRVGCLVLTPWGHHPHQSLSVNWPLEKPWALGILAELGCKPVCSAHHTWLTISQRCCHQHYSPWHVEESWERTCAQPGFK